MKIKYNIPKLNELKEKINNVKRKVDEKNRNKEKIPMRYYTLLLLMLVVGVITFTNNVKKYNDINSENYIEYNLDDNITVDSNDVQNIIYETAVSSISTNVSNMDDIEQEDNNKSDEKNYIWPVNGRVIKEYAKEGLTYSKTLDMWRVHPGIDIKADLDQGVCVIESGRIVDIYKDSFYGNTIKIQHDDGYVSVYSNLDDSVEVAIGDKVNKGDVIGKIGVSAHGELADEVHLHFEILVNNESINPLEILE